MRLARRLPLSPRVPPPVDLIRSAALCADECAPRDPNRSSSAPPILTDIFDDILAAGISLKEARIEVEKIIGRGSGFVAVEIPFTPRAKRVFELALEEARQLGHNYIGTEHLLLGLLREGEGVAARVLENLDADPSKIRSQVIRMVGESQEAVGAAPGAGGRGGGIQDPDARGVRVGPHASKRRRRSSTRASGASPR